METKNENNKLEETRLLSRDALKTVLTIPKNVKVFSKSIKKVSKNEDERIHLTYQAIGDIIQEKSLSDVLLNIKEKRIGWDNSFYDGFKKTLEEHDDFVTNPFEVAEGVSECRKCGSKKTYSCQRQVRRADELMTTFSTCVNCGSSWTYSG